MFLFLSEGAFDGRTCGYFGKLQRRLRNNSPVSCTRLFNDLGSLECFKTRASVFSADPENSSSCGDTHAEDPLNADYF